MPACRPHRITLSAGRGRGRDAARIHRAWLGLRRLVELPGEDHAFLFGGRPTLERELVALLERAAARPGAAII